MRTHINQTEAVGDIGVELEGSASVADFALDRTTCEFLTEVLVGDFGDLTNMESSGMDCAELVFNFVARVRVNLA